MHVPLYTMQQRKVDKVVGKPQNLQEETFNFNLLILNLHGQ
jgi:hypothetical protein